MKLRKLIVVSFNLEECVELLFADVDTATQEWISTSRFSSLSLHASRSSLEHAITRAGRTSKA